MESSCTHAIQRPAPAPGCLHLPAPWQQSCVQRTKVRTTPAEGATLAQRHHERDVARIHVLRQAPLPRRCSHCSPACRPQLSASTRVVLDDEQIVQRVNACAVCAVVVLLHPMHEAGAHEPGAHARHAVDL
jgi:hypothetical protein